MKNKWYEAVKQQRGEVEEPKKERKPGICECGCSGFRHKIKDRKLIRICPKCKDEKVF